jgi:eukaryotic-like serine/threonine-protein kinase
MKTFATMLLILLSIVPGLSQKKASQENKPDLKHLPQLTTKWKFVTGGKVNAAPVIHNKRVYFGSGDNNLYAVEAASGKEAWRFSTGGPVYSSPAIANDKAYFLSFDGNFYAVNAGNGKELWRFSTGGERWYGEKGLWGMQPADLFMEDLFQYWLSSPVVGPDNTIYFGSSDHHLFALDGKTGKLKWKFKTEGPIHTSPALQDGLVIIGSWDRNIYAIDAKTGVEKWRYTTRTDDSGWGGLQGLQASPIVYDGKVYCGSRDAHFYALDLKSGKRIWEYKTGGTWIVGSAVAANGKIFVGTSDTFLLLVLDAATGELLNSTRTNGYVYSRPALYDKYALFGTFTGKLVCVDLETNTIYENWQTESGKINSPQVLKDGTIDFGHLFEGLDMKSYDDNVKAVRKLDLLGPIVCSPVIYDGCIYFGSGDGSLYCVGL